MIGAASLFGAEIVQVPGSSSPRSTIVAFTIAISMHIAFGSDEPSKTVKASYDLEYGTDSLEMHCDAVDRGTRVLVVDDLLATGGTAKATLSLLRGCGAEVVGVSFLIELVALGGRARLAGEHVSAILQY